MLVNGEAAEQPGLIKDTTTQGFRQDVIAESMQQPVLVDFWAPWCGPCKQLTPVIEKAVKAAGGKVKLVKMNIDEHPQISGQLGIRLVNLGEQIAVGKNIVSLQALSPVFADFTLPQQDLEKISPGLSVRVTSDTFPDKKFEGELTAINPDLDAATRSVRVRAKLANADKMLRPGMFVRAEVQMPGDQKVLVIPATAVLSAPYGASVFVIEPQTANGKTSLIVQQKFIPTGRPQGDFVSVESGLKAGDKVVTAGLFKLRNGMAVVENNDIAPKTSNTPTPPNT